MKQPNPESDEQLLLRLRRLEIDVAVAASSDDRRVLLTLQSDLLSLLTTLKQRSDQLLAKINEANLKFDAATAYARCATLGRGMFKARTMTKSKG
jgi:hypothetical protein